MAITRAQQARQLLEDGGMLVQPSMDGKRPGYRSARTQEVQGRTSTYSGNTGKQGPTDNRAVDRSSDAQTINQLRNQNRFVAEDYDLLPGDTPDSGVDIKLNEREKQFQNFLNRRNRVNLFGSGKFFEKPAQIFSDYNASINRPFFKDVIRAGKFNYTTKDGKPLSFDMTEDDFEDAYQNYMSSRLRGEIDAYGNPIDQDDDNNNIIIPDSTMNQGSSTTEQEKDTPFVPYRFLADGGRIGAQQGGIMPRLNELSGDVSSAEQMLQEINQRLQSAESSLGEGGGGGMGSLPDNFQPAIPAENTQPQATFSGFGQPLFDKDGFRLGDQRYGTGLVGGPKMALPSLLNQTSEGPIQSPMQDAIKQQFADGGMAEEDDPVGGIMDLESGRQMYFLGKLVKKATRAVKKVVKSPFGKALILGGLTFGIPGVSKGFFSKGLMGTKSGLGFKKFLGDKILGEATMKQGTTQRSGGLLNFIKNNKALSGILGASTLAGLSAPQSPDNAEQEDDFRLEIPEQYRFYAEGGKAEPVAKKTMPLLDMDGKEKDYRETGGFVDMGRMERADDVPARLSKNEFVFTADAVRNAGEGDIDKGAEVMYNMMKNLEAGGEVSEESQGLDGARNMFQTSQRLEEVL